jgi:hypothetical protein
MEKDFNKKFIQMKADLYEDTQLTVQRLMEMQKEMKESFNKKMALLLEDRGYFKKIVIPKNILNYGNTETYLFKFLLIGDTF